MARRLRTPSQLNSPALLMNFPFTLDNRVANNVWMNPTAAIDHDAAHQQWLGLYKSLACRALVYLLPSVGNFQDLPYVANLGCYLPHLKRDTILLANFTSPPRRGEDEIGRRFFISLGYEVRQPAAHWEGEADLKYLHDNVYVGGFGMRSQREAFDWMSDKFDMAITCVELRDPKLYHFDCSFCPLSGDRALVTTSAFTRTDLRALERVVDVIDVPKKYAYHGWTNCLLLGRQVFHAPPLGDDSESAFRTFIEGLGLDPVIVYLWEFEKSGADLSCLVMHLNYCII